MTFASNITFFLNNLKILRPKIKKNLTNLRKNFCEFLHKDLDLCSEMVIFKSLLTFLKRVLFLRQLGK